MGQCSLRPNPSTTAPTPAPELTEDIVEEILLRFPPSEPASHVRAALVCKQWCRLISEPRFRRRFREFHLRSREFHRTPPPMLGFFCNMLAGDGGVETARFVPTSTFCSPRGTDLRRCSAIDARHGRVLLQCPGKAPSSETALVVWDPISDEQRDLHVPTGWRQEFHGRPYGWNAAVLCAAAVGCCDHLDCHREPFLVVLVNSNYCVNNLFTSTYSSDSGTWSDRIFPINYPFDYVRLSSLPCAHVGNVLYFGSENSDTAVKYHLCLRETSLISIPALDDLVFPYVFPYVLTATEDGGLRYTGLHRSKLYMWLKDDDGPNVDGRDTRWTLDRVIELKMLLRSNAIWASPRIIGCTDGASARIIGFADGAGVIFLVTADDVLFTFDLNTKTMKKVSKGISVHKVLPYMSLYTPALGAAFRGEGPSEGG